MGFAEHVKTPAPENVKPTPAKKDARVRARKGKKHQKAYAGYNGQSKHPDPRLERALKLFAFDGYTKTDAYRKAFNSRAKDNSLHSTASRAFSSEGAPERLLVLFAEKEAKENAAKPGSDIAGKDELLRELTKVIRTPGSDAAKVSAIEKLAKHLESAENESGELATVNPDLVANHLVQFASWPPERIAQEIGGIYFLIQRMAAIMQTTPRAIRDAIDAGLSNSDT